MKRFVGLLILGATLGKIFGFIRELVLAHAVGVSLTADSFRASISAIIIPLALFQGDAISIIMIPILSEWRRTTTNAYTRFTLLILWICGFTVVTTVCLEWMAADWVHLVVSGFSPRAMTLTISFIHIVALTMPAMVAFNCFSTMEVALGRAQLISIRSSIQNIGIVAGILVFMITGNELAIPWGFTIAINVITLYGLIILLRNREISLQGWSSRMAWESLTTFARHLVPVIVQPIAEQGQSWIERGLASVNEGTIAALDYSRTLSECTVYLLCQPIGTVVLTSQIPRERIPSIAKYLLVITLPASVLTVLMANPLVVVVLQRGSFDERAVELTSQCLTGISFGATWAGALGYVLLRQLYRERHSRVATLIYVSSYVINILFNLVFSSRLGAEGFGLGETCRGIWLMVGCAIFLGCIWPILYSIGQCVPACLAMMITCMLINLTDLSSFKQLTLSITAYVIITLLNASMMMPQETSLTIRKFEGLLSRFIYRFRKSS